MNLYNSSDPAKAEIVLAEAWAQSALSEGHRRGLPKGNVAPNIKAGLEKRAKIGVTNAVRNLVKSRHGTFCRNDLSKAGLKFSGLQISSALQVLVGDGTISVVGRNSAGMNIYALSGVAAEQ